ncbi:exonuclease, DNA polymerase III, epsilon subunit family [Neisseria sp. oral taxon 014 str. F0314]|uniref:3'-5' exonuclease family protein n=1 Tax=Neisseria sp. oral taxon 014 TaxID=641148 RepID=UPI0001D8C310|nr:3'-5' exonuclease family protein [Neisseria sp. oral taxon 014]EFI24794.1 exonuclease, DNA polymerase III, epsilon subunit family [Neisseria sp. oral taxon 014 str. F0314]
MTHTMRWPNLAAAFAGFGRPVAVVDLESTGGNFYRDRITEVAVLRFERGAAKRYEWLVNPQQPIPKFVADLTGITDEAVSGAPVFSDIAADLLPLLHGAVVVAHNSRFDYTFLRHEFRRAGMDFAAPALCTVQLSRRLYPQFYRHNLDSIIERFGIAVESRHRAMADVAALSDFLERSLVEKGAEEWERHCRSLMNPKMLPASLPEGLSRRLYRLPDSSGVLIWLDESEGALAVGVHERAYSETAAALHGGNIPPYVAHAAEVRFLPAAGGLHALWLKAQAEREYALRPSEKSGGYLTVNFVPDERGALQARIVPLANGSRDGRPYGLFVHKKAARRALAAWALEHGLCPDSLNILPEKHAQGLPCPVHAVGRCSGGCGRQDGIGRQNERILTAAHLLPVTDWGRVREMEVTETDVLTGESITLRCAGGALALPDGSWYFDDTLPAVLKAKFKQGRDGIKVVA